MTTKRTAAAADTVATLLNPTSRGFAVSLEEAICNLCNGPATTFTDDLSAKEYTISAMCQVCQDATFGPPDEEPLSPADAIRLMGSAQ